MKKINIKIFPGFILDGVKSMFLYFYQQPILSEEACARKFGDDFHKKQHFCVRTRLGGGGCWGYELKFPGFKFHRN